MFEATAERRASADSRSHASGGAAEQAGAGNKSRRWRAVDGAASCHARPAPARGVDTDAAGARQWTSARQHAPGRHPGIDRVAVTATLSPPGRAIGKTPPLEPSACLDAALTPPRHVGGDDEQYPRPRHGQVSRHRLIAPSPGVHVAATPGAEPASPGGIGARVVPMNYRRCRCCRPSPDARSPSRYEARRRFAVAGAYD